MEKQRIPFPDPCSSLPDERDSSTNQRKQRRGAFWEDRYHATAVESGEHLIECLVYIDLNMVRAGVVGHPKQWSFGGYREIQNPKQRYGIIDYARLITVLGMKTPGGVQESCKGRVEEALCREEQCRQAKWTESLAVGSEQYVGGIQRELGVRAKGRKVTEAGGSHQLRESEIAYRCQYEDEKGLLRLNNTFLWNLTSDSSAP